MSEGLSDDMKIETIPDLLKRVNEEYLKRQAEALQQQKVSNAKLLEAVQEEGRLTREIDKEEKIVKKLQSDFLDLEIKFKKEAIQKAEGDFLREKDLRSGKVKLADFLLRGKKDKDIAEEVAERTAEELEAGLKGIKAKNFEILKLDKLRAEQRNLIRGLIVQPGQFMLTLFKELKEFTEQEIGSFIGDMEGYRTELQEIERQIILIEKGIGLTSGYRWDSLTPKEALEIQFSPLLPIECVPKLKVELEKCKDADRVVVNYFWRSKDVDVTPFFNDPKRRIVTTSKIARKVLSTSTFTLDREEKEKQRYWDKEQTLKKPAVTTSDIENPEDVKERIKRDEIIAQRKKEKKNG